MFCLGKHVSVSCGAKLFLAVMYPIEDQVIINALSTQGVRLGNNTFIGFRTMIKLSWSLTAIGKGFSLGNYSTMGNDCFVGAAGGVEIGEYVAIVRNLRFHSENHRFDDISKKCEQGIRVENDCWIGVGSIILDCSEIGNDCVVGANSLATKKCPGNVVTAGNPAKIIKVRGEGQVSK